VSAISRVRVREWVSGTSSPGLSVGLILGYGLNADLRTRHADWQ